MSLRSLYPRNRVLALSSDELMTKQSHKDECDIHKILSQYKRTGIIAHINARQPVYADLPDSMDYQDAIEIVRDAQEAFAELPASVREKFNNDPYNLLAAISDPSKAEELRDLGILKRPTPSDFNPPAPAAPAPAPAPVPPTE